MQVGDEWVTEAGMTSEQQRACFELRMKLSEAGYNWRAMYPSGEFAPPTTSERGIWALGHDRGEATLTAIIGPDGSRTVVTVCPLTAAEREAAERQRLVDEEAKRLALIEDAKAQRREREAAKRRAKGIPSREEWEAEHAVPPWQKAGFPSKATFYRHKRKAAAEGGKSRRKEKNPNPITSTQ